MIRRALVLLAVCIPYIVRAECPVPEYTFSGRVNAANAQVDVRIDRDESVAVHADAKGHYTVSVSFGVESGSCFGHERCGRRPRRVRISATDASGRKGTFESDFDELPFDPAAVDREHFLIPMIVMK